MTPDDELAQANQDIAAVRAYLAQQLQRIRPMEANGRKTKLAWSSLLAVEQALATMRERRRRFLTEDAAGPPAEP